MNTRPHVIGIMVLLFTAISTLAAQDQDGNQSYVAHRVDAHIVVLDPVNASVELAEFADTHGGYFVTRSRDMVVVRVPVEILDETRSTVLSYADAVIRYDPSSRDYRTELMRVDAGITSREESLDQIFQYVEEADIGATLAFEQELRAINSELELLKGQRRRIENDIRYANVSIALTSNATEIPVHIPSSFAWINRIDLYRFIDEERM